MSKYRTPLRYPGGKQKLTPFVFEILRENDLLGGEYVEPYAGGAGVAMELLLGGHVAHVHLNDSSLPIFAFWSLVVDRPEDLCRRIASASLNVEEWRRRREIVRRPTEHDQLEVGFSAFYLNRCNRSGVLTGGLIGGLAQSGEWKMDARFPRNELIRRVEAIATRSTDITLRNLDAERFLLDYVPTLPEQTFVYCDPPYYEKSSRLYLDRYVKDDHAHIAKVIQEQVHKKWIVSYDNTDEVTRLYSARTQFAYDLQYNASRVYKGREVFIFSDEVSVPERSSLPHIDLALRARNAA